jgi:hypothetical protein
MKLQISHERITASSICGTFAGWPAEWDGYISEAIGYDFCISVTADGKIQTNLWVETGNGVTRALPFDQRHDLRTALKQHYDSCLPTLKPIA